MHDSRASRSLIAATVCAGMALVCGNGRAEDPLRITVQTSKLRQTFEGLGAGVIFYEQHVTSLDARQKKERQAELYDDMFARVPTRFLQIMIREVHEPQNDNDDPWTPAFDEKNFEYCRHTLQIAKAARERQPEMQFCATLYTPPPWMKTNNDASGGGESRATLRDGFELELAEYIWAFLAHTQRNGVTIDYLNIANEPDWPHTQPGYCLTPERYAALFVKVADYLHEMSRRHPEVPKPKLIAPNTLSAPGAARDYLPPLLKRAGGAVDVIGVHDYDPRGDRWGALKKLAGKRPLWLTEWCARDKDSSPGMINSATQYAVAMHDAFQGGANVWLAYDWAYPPRDSGEALIHIDWGNDYTLAKPYWVFRQWAEPLVPGMHVAGISLAGPGTGRDGNHPGVKATAFVADDGTVAVHIVNVHDKSTAIALKLTGKQATANTTTRTRTSATEDIAPLAPLRSAGGSFADKLPARSLVTYRFDAPAK
jgi:O-glycosyl hydrolase